MKLAFSLGIAGALSKVAWGLGITGAVLFHASVLLFGGLLFPDARPHVNTTQEVELLSEVDAQDEEQKPEEEKIEAPEEIESETEQPPDAIEIAQDIELASEDDAPALDAASLGAIEAALNQQGGGGDFSDALSFSSGGRIGGTGTEGGVDKQLDVIVSLDEIDQEPRPVFQTAPLYPSELRGKKLQGVVTMIFVVDAGGKVSNPRVEKSTHPAFEKPAMEAVKQWKFEPGLKGGQRVARKVRQSMRFQPS